MSAARNERLGLLFALLSFLFCLAARAAELPPLTHGLTPMREGRVAPPLRLAGMDEEWVDLADFRGKVVVVNFWATWCPPCRREMPSLERLNRMVGEKGVVVLAVNVGEDFDTVFAFTGMLEPPPTFPLLLDRDSASLAAWKVKGLPTTFVVGPDGKLAYRAVGGREFDHPEVVAQLMELMRGHSESGPGLPWTVNPAPMGRRE